VKWLRNPDAPADNQAAAGCTIPRRTSAACAGKDSNAVAGRATRNEEHGSSVDTTRRG